MFPLFAARARFSIGLARQVNFSGVSAKCLSVNTTGVACKRDNHETYLNYYTVYDFLLEVNCRTVHRFFAVLTN